MCGQLSILSNYFFLYLDYCAGGSVRAEASSTCDQMRSGSYFTCTFTQLAHSRVTSITIDRHVIGYSFFSLCKTRKDVVTDPGEKFRVFFKAMFAAYLFAPVTCSPALASSVSHGFFRLAVVVSEACPWSTTLGTSLMPGTGSPLLMSPTIWLKDVGYGVGGSLSSTFVRVSMPLQEVASSLGRLLLTMEGLDAETMTEMPLAREEDC